MPLFTDKIEAADYPKMSAEYQDLLRRILTIQADCEIGGPHMYVSGILLKAPTVEDQYRMARIVAEEMDHFRKVNNLLKEIGYDASDRLRVANRQRYLETFRGQIKSWVDMSAFGCLIDRVGKYQLQELYDGSYQPATRMLPKVMMEEEGHIAFGAAKLREYCRTERGKELAQVAINHWWVMALDMFGRSNSARTERYIEWGIRKRTNEEGRRQYIEEASAVIRDMGLQVPDVHAGRKYL